MTERRVHLSLATDAASGGALRPDGTLWSHAVTPGTYNKDGESFTIGAAELSSFVRNFNSAYPSKVPVDYEHGTTNGSTSVGVAVPKAGDVLEMHAVLSESDLTPDIQASIDHTRAEWAALGFKREINPLGLWVRWKPVPKALSMLKAREYTEMSIAFHLDFSHNGEPQGPTVIAVALTNRPFVDTMASIAASADTTGAPPRNTEQGKMRFFSLLSAKRGKPVTNEAEAETELTALAAEHATATTELATANGFRDVIAAEFAGEKDATKLVTAIRNLNTSVTNLTAERNAARDKEITAVVELAMRGFEKKLTVPAKTLYAGQLAAELKAGKELGKTDTEKALGSLPDLPNLTAQDTNVSQDGKGLTDDGAIMARVTELTTTDPTIKAIKDPNARLLQAVSKARAEFTAAAAKK